MAKLKYYIIPIDGYDAKTTINSIEKVLGKESGAEILRSNDISQVLHTPSMNNFSNEYAVCVTSDYECKKDPKGLVKLFDEKNPFIYSPDEKLFIIDMGHGKSIRYFTEANISTGHIKAYLNFDLSSAHMFKEVDSFYEYFQKRGTEIKKVREKSLELTKEDAAKFIKEISVNKKKRK